MGPRPDLRRILRPLGPVAVFGAGNFPFAFSVPGGDTASALAAGCPVIAKVHEGHPATSVMARDALVEGARAVGISPAVLSLVFGQEAGAGSSSTRRCRQWVSPVRSPSASCSMVWRRRDLRPSRSMASSER